MIVKKLPVVPFAGCQYKSTQTDTVDQTNSTFSSVAIGAAHLDRIIILAIFQGVNGALTTASVNGYDAYHITTLNEFSIAACKVPNDTTATIVVGATSSVRKAVGVYVAYPQHPLPTFFGSGTANVGTNATVANVKAVNNGCLIYSGGQLATLGTFTTTWGGSDAVTENADAQLEATSSYTNGNINFTVSSGANTVTLAASANGTKRLIVACWGPPRGY